MASSQQDTDPFPSTYICLYSSPWLFCWRILSLWWWTALGAFPPLERFSCPITISDGSSSFCFGTIDRCAHWLEVCTISSGAEAVSSWCGLLHTNLPTSRGWHLLSCLSPALSQHPVIPGSYRHGSCCGSHGPGVSGPSSVWMGAMDWDQKESLLFFRLQ